MSDLGFPTNLPQPEMDETVSPDQNPLEAQDPLAAQGIELFSDELRGSLEDILVTLEGDDATIRQQVAVEARRNHAFWRGYSKLLWDATLSDHITIQQLQAADQNYDDYRDTSINIYRATGETMVAAISSTLPQLAFEPDDANNPADLLASKAYPKLRKKIERDNEVVNLFSRAAFIRWNEHFVAWYNYIEQDKKHGSIKRPIYTTQEQSYMDYTCIQCNEQVDEPSQDNMDLSNCDNCGLVQPNAIQQSYPVQVQTGEEEVEKCKEQVEVYGSLNVKIATNATSLKQSPYLILEHEEDLSWVREKYPWMYDKIGGGAAFPTDRSSYDRIARTNIDWRSVFGNNKVTVKEVWLRPEAFNHLNSDDDTRTQLREMFPSGCKATWLGEEFACAEESELDKHWSIATPATSRFLYSEPPGNFQVATQTMRDEAIDLMLESLEQGIPETFVDANILSLPHYQQHDKRPGLVFPVNKPAGESLGNAFYQTSMATFPKDAPGFVAQLDRDGQQTSGVAAPLWGGPSFGGTGTLGEYQGSTQRSLQRQTIPWRDIVTAYAECIKKACDEYKEYMIEDESFPQKQGSDYVAVWLRTEELGGKIGKVSVENSDRIPITWDQREDRILQIFNSNNQAAQQILFHPNNAQVIADFIGTPDLYIPGADDRNKQLVQIAQMLMNLQTIQPDPNTDNNDICIEVTKHWFNSPAGMDAQNSNQEGYIAVQQQLLMRLQIQQQQQMMQAQMQPMEGNPNA